MCPEPSNSLRGVSARQLANADDYGFRRRRRPIIHSSGVLSATHTCVCVSVCIKFSIDSWPPSRSPCQSLGGGEDGDRLIDAVHKCHRHPTINYSQLETDLCVCVRSAVLCVCYCVPYLTLHPKSHLLLLREREREREKREREEKMMSLLLLTRAAPLSLVGAFCIPRRRRSFVRRTGGRNEN